MPTTAPAPTTVRWSVEGGYTTGQVGQAFSFDGTSQYVRVPDSPSLKPTNLTIEGWFQFSSAPGSSLRTLFGKTVGSGSLDSYVVWYANGTLNGAIGNGGSERPVSTSFTPVVGAWYHVAFSFDDPSNTMVLYLNGSQVATGSTTLSVGYDTTHDLLIGAEVENSALNYYFPGAIDQVNLWNRALTSSEVAAEYLAGIISTFTESGGTTTINGTLNVLTGSASIQGGTLKGTGAINASVVKTAGILAPGNSPGFFNITGNYTQGPGGPRSGNRWAQQ